MASFVKARSNNCSFPVHINLWKSKAPPRVLVFGWLMLQGSILTMDNLQRRGMVVVNACPLCISAKNQVDHSMLNYTMAYRIWITILNWFGCGRVLPRSIVELFEAWKLRIGTSKGKTMWRLLFLATVWAIWTGRNRRCFERSSSSLVEVVDMARLSVTWRDLMWRHGYPSYLHFKDYLLTPLY